ncbi:hypothetical protein [Bacillus paranthracis]|uniref:hypothetical protein n=1 Tax=Bacillus paranthracis TaxID=2026186 RepID=UPI000D6C4296|nr:hypothetical protein [Bacillus paranthracis]PWN75186.1 hypothetical protein CV741_04980 [Bacillus cereus]PWN80912.1 hypothetical protein CV717_11275 [Bacillus cereus]UHJ52867.1 hypothetical protein LU294_12170 [Bacillus paranthracis]
MNSIQIEINILNKWIKQFLPEYDLFFFPKKYGAVVKHFTSNTLLMPKEEFSNHTIFNNINSRNSYQVWNIHKDIQFVCVANSSLIMQWDKETRESIFRIQFEVNRGSIYEWDMIECVLEDIPSPSSKTAILQHVSPYSFTYDSKRYISMQKSLWDNLHKEFQYKFLLLLTKQFVYQTSLSKEQIKKFENSFPHIAPYFNSFSSVNGANCLAATLASICSEKSEAKWIITKWVHDNSFLKGLQIKQYRLKSASIDSLQPSDILVWKNEKNKVLHASFHLGGGYFFNKNGQSFFNPWQLVHIESLLNTWENERIEVYRK